MRKLGVKTKPGRSVKNKQHPKATVAYYYKRKDTTNYV